MVDADLAQEVRVGDTVIYREAVHKVVGLAPWAWPPTFKLQGPYAADTYVSHTLLHFPVLLNVFQREEEQAP